MSQGTRAVNSSLDKLGGNVNLQKELVDFKSDFHSSRSEAGGERSEVTNRVVFGLITWFAGPGKSSREFVYIFNK